jgi:uncharacterized protein (DUF1015 family)
MAEVLPFVGLRYNSQQIGALGKVITPPFDEISPELQETLHRRHILNMVRLELGRDGDGEEVTADRYSRAGTTLQAWCRDGVLVEDQQPSLYIMESSFTQGKLKLRQLGVLALVKLNEQQVRGHENTFEGPKADRLKLLRATQANISPIFGLFEDPSGAVDQFLAQNTVPKPWETAQDDQGTCHRLWVVQKREAILAFREALKDQDIYIADGHHRYETALAYRDEMRKKTGKKDGRQAFDYVFMYLSLATQEGLVVKPIHRLFSRQMMAEVDFPQSLEDLEESFIITKQTVDLADPGKESERLLKALTSGKNPAQFALVLPSGKAYLLRLRPDINPADLVDAECGDEETLRLDANLLHHVIVNQVMVGNPDFEIEEEDCQFLTDAPAVLEALKLRKGGMAVLMRPTPIQDILSVSKKGLKMPPRTTHFFPKPPVGLVIRSMISDNRLQTKKS